MAWWQVVLLVLFLAAVVFYTVKVIRPKPEPIPRSPGTEDASAQTRPRDAN